MRTHPPSLTTLTRRVLESDQGPRAGDSVLVAVSGGPDSMALLHVLSRLRTKGRFSLFAHGVDHGLRSEAEKELDLAERFSTELGVPWSRSVLSVSPGGNLQARARDARYEALRSAKGVSGAHLIATAHHADDRAETFLLRLLRGAGPTGLAVLPSRAEDLIRPFILARRSDIVAYVDRHKIPFSSDPSNRSPRFLRTRVRHEVLPLLSELNPGIVEHLCAVAEQLSSPPPPLPDGFMTLPRRTREALDELVRAKSPRGRVELPGGLVAALDATQAEIVVLPSSLVSDKSRQSKDDSKPPTAENRHHKETPFSDPSRRTRTTRERSFP